MGQESAGGPPLRETAGAQGPGGRPPARPSGPPRACRTPWEPAGPADPAGPVASDAPVVAGPGVLAGSDARPVVEPAGRLARVVPEDQGDPEAALDARPAGRRIASDRARPGRPPAANRAAAGKGGGGGR